MLSWTKTDLEPILNAAAAEEGIGFGKLAQPLRAALAGRTATPSVYDMMLVIGRDETIARLQDAQFAGPDRTSPPRATVNGGYDHDRSDQVRHADPERQDLRPARAVADHRAGCAGHPQALWPGRRLHLRSGLHLDRRLRKRHHLYRRRQGRAFAPRLSDRTTCREIDLSRSVLPAALRRTADRRAAGRFRQPRDAPHHGA